ncbi:FG-GAP-like repeat-containing protein [Saccharicrinis sp. FJH62]|uniref:FG-GAP-like repeat-containing protein n=1 Tax=Saccharicrinis sp. FJH62 TaxID=3344657 RepID=UPI0035D3F113
MKRAGYIQLLHSISALKIIAAYIFLSFGSSNMLHSQPFREISLQSHLSSAFNNNGIAVADYDDDNDRDIFIVSRWNNITNVPVASQLFRNNNDGSFTDVTAESGIVSRHNYFEETVPGPFGFGEQMSASWGDYDNDGFPDLFLASALFYELYHNNQDGTFTNVTKTAGFTEKNSCYSTHALWFDFNNDSYPDLYITSVFSCSGALYKNNADGTFTNFTDSVGLNPSGQASWMSIPWDINSDGFQDLYIAKDFDLPNEFFINDKGTFFRDSAAEYGIEDEFKDGMGLALADYNNDGYPDMFITSINESALYKNMDNRSFTDVAPELYLEKTEWAWACQFADFDNDLDQDLMVLNGYFLEFPNKYYENLLNTGEEKFEEKAAAYGLDESTYSSSLAVFDYDNDGDLDMLVGSTDKQIQFFENQRIETAPKNTSNWVSIDLEGTTSNRDAIGTLIQVKVKDQVLSRYKHGSSIMAQSLLPVHFGLGSYNTIEELTITWPSGLKETYYNIPANKSYYFTEDYGYYEIYINTKKIPGCTDPASCSYDPAATLDDGSCTYLESFAIEGNTTAGVLTEQTYSYPSAPGSTCYWQITNGKIIEGQGDSVVTVRWGIAEKGGLSVREVNACSSLPVVLDVNLNATDVPDNISVARMWNESLLQAIREDYARPTVHARNLFHTSIALYDAWALFDDKAETYLIGKELHNFINNFNGFSTGINKDVAVKTAMSYAAYRLLSYRFKNSPHHDETQQRFDALMKLFNYDMDYTSSNYSGGDPRALGNFIGQSIIVYGLSDGSNEINKYANTFYKPANEPLIPNLPGNPSVSDPNRWQPLQLEIFIDQAGNITSENTPAFLSPEWGNVKPFALKDEDASSYSRDGNLYTVYHDPGSPPMLNKMKLKESDMDLYKWNFSMVSVWSSHLNPCDSVMWDISPASIGNIDFNTLPKSITEHNEFYNFLNGGDTGKGRTVNPVTGKAYESQVVPRGDYTRVLAEFWADGPDSETPPGHWFVLLNYISDHSEFKRMFKGQDFFGDQLEWDVKSYFTLGGAMHDAAVTSWGIKGWYDFIRPVSAIRYMADMGQSTDPEMDNYTINGIPLIDGLIEIVQKGDTLAGPHDENVGKIKLYAWRGHHYINNPEVDQAGVGWILAENWWPYQRPSFVTPPFAGYVSGHSTYSRAAAEVITALTGSPYFPGGMGEFVAKKNEFLVFEEGPSQDITLQWATYRDASDQCSLSRIWGGIHPPCDDITGRLIGETIGKEAFAFAEHYFNGDATGIQLINQGNNSEIYPNPVSHGLVYITSTGTNQDFRLYDVNGKELNIDRIKYHQETHSATLSVDNLPKGFYLLKSGQNIWKIVIE